MAFPSTNHFQPILIKNQPIFDIVSDHSPTLIDFVENIQFSAAFSAYDVTNVHLRAHVKGTQGTPS